MLRLSFVSVFLLAACNSSGGDDQGDDQGDDAPAIDAAPPGNGDPRSGLWHYDEYGVTAGDCDLGTQLDQDGDFGLENHGNGTFTITPGDGTDPFLCTLDGSDFACPNRATAEYTEPGLDATIDGMATADGTFSTDEDGSGQQTVYVTCTGGDCAAVETYLGVDFPCTFVADFDISWRSL